MMSLSVDRQCPRVSVQSRETIDTKQSKNTSKMKIPDRPIEIIITKHRMIVAITLLWRETLLLKSYL